MKIEQITLEGNFVRLEPLSNGHKDGLCKAISDGELWKLQVTLVPHMNEIDNFLSNAIEINETGKGLTFATIEKGTNLIAGSTSFRNINFPNKRLEIGYTFLGKTWQRTKINTEAKLLMLCHAFENLQINRVEFLTDFLNNSSRKAILRLGAKEEGVLRNHMVMPNGRVRDSVLFSIVADEWTTVKSHLRRKLL